MQFQFLGWEDPLEKEMTTHSCILASRIPWTEEPGERQSTGLQRVRHNLATKWQVFGTVSHFGVKSNCKVGVTQKCTVVYSL